MSIISDSNKELSLSVIHNNFQAEYRLKLSVLSAIVLTSACRGKNYPLPINFSQNGSMTFGQVVSNTFPRSEKLKLYSWSIELRQSCSNQIRTLLLGLGQFAILIRFLRQRNLSSLFQDNMIQYFYSSATQLGLTPPTIRQYSSSN